MSDILTSSVNEVINSFYTFTVFVLVPPLLVKHVVRPPCKSGRTNRFPGVISVAVGGSLSCRVYEKPMLSIIYQETTLRATRESESFSLSFGEQSACGFTEKMCWHAYV